MEIYSDVYNSSLTDVAGQHSYFIPQSHCLHPEYELSCLSDRDITHYSIFYVCLKWVAESKCDTGFNMTRALMLSCVWKILHSDTHNIRMRFSCREMLRQVHWKKTSIFKISLYHSVTSLTNQYIWKLVQNSCTAASANPVTRWRRFRHALPQSMQRLCIYVYESNNPLCQSAAMTFVSSTELGFTSSFTIYFPSLWFCCVLE